MYGRFAWEFTTARSAFVKATKSFGSGSGPMPNMIANSPGVDTDRPPPSRSTELTFAFQENGRGCDRRCVGIERTVAMGGRLVEHIEPSDVASGQSPILASARGIQGDETLATRMEGAFEDIFVTGTGYQGLDNWIAATRAGKAG
jgi:hypothetical protein